MKILIIVCMAHGMENQCCQVIYNREERRKYIKEHKHGKDATNCIYCNVKTMTITDDNGDFVCELCGRFKAKKVEIRLGE